MNEWNPLFPKPGKRETLSDIDSRVWRIFSELIRRRDAGKSEYLRCITCGTPVHWKRAHAGHCIPRGPKNLPVKFNYFNVNGQCEICNYSPGGRREIHQVRIDQKWGVGTYANLIVLSRDYSECRMGKIWYFKLEEEFKTRLFELKNEGYGVIK